MVRRAIRVWGGIQLGLALCAVSAASAATGAHETLTDQLTTQQPGAPAGFSFTGTYHAAGDPNGNPPYMRAMTFYSPPGQRWDTSVPDRCTASTAELELRGGAACPPGSQIGSGEVSASLFGEFPSKLPVQLFNNTDEEIVVASSPGEYTVSRGHIHTNGSVSWVSGTCFPMAEPPGCPVDNALQEGSHLEMKPYVRTIDGRQRSYLTTAPSCPATGHWTTTVRLWWKDGTDDVVSIEQPCTNPARPVARRSHAHKKKKHKHHRRRHGHHRRHGHKHH